MVDVDNMAFEIALGERLRTRVEESGRVMLTLADTKLLSWTKAVHIAAKVCLKIK